MTEEEINNFIDKSLEVTKKNNPGLRQEELTNDQFMERAIKFACRRSGGTEDANNLFEEQLRKGMKQDNTDNIKNKSMLVSYIVICSQAKQLRNKIAAGVENNPEVQAQLEKFATLIDKVAGVSEKAATQSVLNGLLKAEKYTFEQFKQMMQPMPRGGAENAVDKEELEQEQRRMLLQKVWDRILSPDTYSQDGGDDYFLDLWGYMDDDAAVGIDLNKEERPTPRSEGGG